jgi:cell division protein ZapA (FtsZ GTPase activity inhibitor)
VENLAKDLDAQLRETLRSSARISQTQAAVLCALSALDAQRQAESTAEQLRASMQRYLEDSAQKERMAELARREAERLHREIKELKSKK